MSLLIVCASSSRPKHKTLVFNLLSVRISMLQPHLISASPLTGPKELKVLCVQHRSCRAFSFGTLSSCRDFAAGLCRIEVSIFHPLPLITNLFLRRTALVLLQEQHYQRSSIFSSVVHRYLCYNCRLLLSKQLGWPQYI